MAHVFPYGNNEHKAFVGALPHELDRKTLEAKVKQWDVGVIAGGIYYQGGGWCTLEFSSKRKKEAFINSKSMYNLCFGRVLDIKNYVYIPKELREATKHPSKKTNISPQKPKAKVASTGPAPVAPWAGNTNNAPAPAAAPIPAAPTVKDHLGFVSRYLPGDLGHLGVISSRSGSNEAIFHVECVYLCRQHKQSCPSASCSPNVVRLEKMPGAALATLLPVNTGVKFHFRRLEGIKDVPFAYQAVAVWTAASARPQSVHNFQSDELDIQLLEYITSPGPPPAPPPQQPQMPPPPPQPAITFPQPTIQHPNLNQDHSPAHARLANLNVSSREPSPAFNLHFGQLGTTSKEMPLMDVINSGFSSNINNHPHPPINGFNRPTADSAFEAAGNTVNGRLESPPNPDDDLDNYLAILDQLRRFLDEQLRDAEATNIPNVVPLARKILKDLGAGMKERSTMQLCMSGTLSIDNFLSKNKVQLEPSKHKRILTNYKVYINTLLHNIKTTIKDLSAVASVNINKLAVDHGLPLGDEGGSVTGSSLSGSYTRVAKNKRKSPLNVPAKQNDDILQVANSLMVSNGLMDETLSDASGRSSTYKLALKTVELGSVKSFVEDTVKCFVEDGGVRGALAKVRSAEPLSNSVVSMLAPLKLSLLNFNHHHDGDADLLSSVLLHTWLSQDKSHGQLLTSFKDLLYRPAELMSRWADDAERAWAGANASGPVVSVAAVVSGAFLYCFDHLHHPKFKLDSNRAVLAAAKSFLVDLPYKSESGNVYNSSGIVVYLFNEFFGVVQTPEGLVLFEKNVAYSYHAGASDESKWRRCKKVHLGAFVKLHVGVGKVKTKRNKVDYYYASKMWISHHGVASTLDLSPGVPGGKSYWKEVLGRFDGLVKANPTLVIGAQPPSCTYELAAAHFLQARLDGRSCSGKEPEDGADAAVVAEFGDALVKQEEFEKVDLVAALKVLRRAGLDAAALRRKHAASGLLLGKAKVFGEAIEQALFAAPMSYYSRRCRQAVIPTGWLSRHFDKSDKSLLATAKTDGRGIFSQEVLSSIFGEMEEEGQDFNNGNGEHDNDNDDATEVVSEKEESLPREKSVASVTPDDSDRESGLSLSSPLDADLEELSRAIDSLHARCVVNDKKMQGLESFRQEIDPQLQADLAKIRSMTKDVKKPAEIGEGKIVLVS